MKEKYKKFQKNLRIRLRGLILRAVLKRPYRTYRMEGYVPPRNWKLFAKECQIPDEIILTGAKDGFYDVSCPEQSTHIVAVEKLEAWEYWQQDIWDMAEALRERGLAD